MSSMEALLQRLRSNSDAQPSSMNYTDDSDVYSDSDTSEQEEAGPSLEQIPFEELERLRQHSASTPPNQRLATASAAERGAGKHTGVLAAAAAAECGGGGAAAAEHPERFKRANKNRPAEQSSKRPVSRFRDVMQAGKHVARDPRVADDLAPPGTKATQMALWRKRYSFLYDEQLPAERAQLKAQLQKVKGAAARAALQEQLGWVEAQVAKEKERRKADKRGDAKKATEKAAVAAGKKPYYLKRSEQRRAELVDRFQELKAGGKLAGYLEKRRKRNAAKDHRYLPSARRAAPGE